MLRVKFSTLDAWREASLAALSFALPFQRNSSDELIHYCFRYGLIDLHDDHFRCFWKFNQIQLETLVMFFGFQRKNWYDKELETTFLTKRQEHARLINHNRNRRYPSALSDFRSFDFPRRSGPASHRRQSALWVSKKRQFQGKVKEEPEHEL